MKGDERATDEGWQAARATPLIREDKAEVEGASQGNDEEGLVTVRGEDAEQARGEDAEQARGEDAEQAREEEAEEAGGEEVEEAQREEAEEIIGVAEDAAQATKVDVALAELVTSEKEYVDSLEVQGRTRP